MKYSEEKGNLRTIIIVAVVILAIIIGVVLINKNKKEDKTVEAIKTASYEYFIVYSADEKVGVIGKNGDVLIPAEYLDIYIPNQSKDVFFCIEDEDGNYKIFDKTGKEIFKEFINVAPIEIANSSLDMEKNVLKYEKEDRYGLIDFTGTVLTEAIYEEVSSLPNKPGCILVKKDGLYGVVDSTGNTIIDIKYNSISGDEFSSEKDGYKKTGYIISTKTSTGILYGYIDYSGELLIEPKYELISRAIVNNSDDIFLIFRENGKRGVIKNKKIIMKPKYQFINYYDKSGVYIVTKNGKYGFYDLEGKEILAPDYTSYSIAGNYICVSQNERTMLYDLHGNLVNANKYKSILETGNPSFFIALDNDGFYSIISKDSEIADNYTNITYAFDNFFLYTAQNGLTGILNVYSGIEVEAEYDYIIVLENAKVLEARKGNEVDIYSSIIEKVLTMKNGVVERISDDYIAVYSETELKYLDKNGKLVENTQVIKDAPLYSYSTGSKWGFKNKAGDVIVEAKYDIVTELNEYGFAGIKKDGKWGVIDKEGTVIVEPSYEIESYYAPSFVGKYLLEKSENLHCVEIRLED